MQGPLENRPVRVCVEDVVLVLFKMIYLHIYRFIDFHPGEYTRHPHATNKKISPRNVCLIFFEIAGHVCIMLSHL